MAVDTKCFAYEATVRKQPLMAQAIAIGFTSLILTNMYEVSRQASTNDFLPLHAEADLNRSGLQELTQALETLEPSDVCRFHLYKSG
jgi:hypothetical protein